MADHSLMNPDHLNREIADTEALSVAGTLLADQVHADIDRIIDYVRPTYNNHQPTTLTVEQVQDLIVTLSNIDLNRWRYYNSHNFAVRVYKALQKDRRWIIASKLRFLKK